MNASPGTIYDAPDRFSDEAVIGWRVWFLHPFTRVKPELLRSMIYTKMWPPRARLESICELPWAGGYGFPAAHPPPTPRVDCGCGIHALQKFEDVEMKESTDTTVVVVGQVSLWGRVVRCTRGWRGQYAYPYSLSVNYGTCHDRNPYALAAQLRGTYGVDCAVHYGHADRRP